LNLAIENENKNDDENSIVASARDDDQPKSALKKPELGTDY
jgi:hypothetical protein